MVRRSVSEKIFREMQEIRHRLDEIERAVSGWTPPPPNVDKTELLSLPDHLRKTYLTALSLGQCDATQVSTHTGRCRTIESSYLNQLARTGWLTKRRDSKNLVFYPVTRKMPTNKDRADQVLFTQHPKSTRHPRGTGAVSRLATKTINVEYIFTDYDGTISPIQANRRESHIALETRVLLSQISRSLPISIITMKDLNFITSKTPFARAWSAIGGLETQIGKRVFKNESVESKLPLISKALEYAKSQAAVAGIEIEEKQDFKGQPIAFCLDWRQTKSRSNAKRAASRITKYCDALGLKVLEYKDQPFCDIYPVDLDKGKALQELLSEMTVKKGVMYLGDSETDNPVFQNPLVSVSIGVIHRESQPRNLECDYLLKFDDVPAFLKTLIVNHFQFSPSFPMIKTNPYRRKLL